MWAIPQAITIVLLPWTLLYQLFTAAEIAGAMAAKGHWRPGKEFFVLTLTSVTIESLFLFTWFVV